MLAYCDTSLSCILNFISLQKLEKLRANLHGLDEAPVNKRTIFVEADDVAQLPEVLPDPTRAPHAKQVEGATARAQSKLEKARAAKYDELQQRQERHSKMGRALERIGLEKALMGKGARRKLKPKKQQLGAESGSGGGGGAPRQFKFKQRRKK